MGLLKADQLRNAAGTGNANLFKQWAAKAFIHLDMINSINRASQNIASSTDTNTGRWSHTLTSAMSASYYATVGSGYPNSYGDTDFSWPNGPSSFYTWHSDGSASYTDAPSVSASLVGELA